jgi:membrane protein required for colicin V production
MNLSFTFIDLGVVGIIVVSTIFAVYRGFVAETLSIVAWAAAAFATLYFGPSVEPLTRGIFGVPWIGILLAYVFVFLIVLIPLSFVSYRMAEGIKKSPVSPLDRVLGVAFGVVRGLVIVGIAYLVFSMIVPIKNQPPWIKDARLLPLIQETSAVLAMPVPDRKTAAAHEKKSAAPGAVPVARPGTETAQKGKPKHGGKTYGAHERRALDRLIETTGDGGHK